MALGMCAGKEEKKKKILHEREEKMTIFRNKLDLSLFWQRYV